MKKDTEEEIVEEFIKYRTAIDSGDWNAPPVVGGIIFNSKLSDDEFRYTLRWGAEREDSLEAKTDKLFSESIIDMDTRFDSCYTKSQSYNCVEERYKDFVLIQSVVEGAYIRLTTNDGSFYPHTLEEMCGSEMV